MNNSKNKVVIVTGGSRGIGRGIVLKLASLGYDVAFSYHSNKEAADSLVGEVKKFGVKCKSWGIDIRDFDATKNWITEVKEEFGQINALINNAGIIADKPLMTMSQEDWSKVVDTNLNGMFNAAKSCIVNFMKQKSGNIINISSVSGIIGLPGQTNYSATKGGINAFTKALAKEVAGFNVRINAVAPGFIETEILENFTEEQREKIISQIPLGRIGTVDDVSSCVQFLLSEAAQYITGQILVVDGGMVMR